ncbi:hypothetical protein M885DRAFT_612937, partial [Pelagophyceae sp. CCMP2097]
HVVRGALRRPSRLSPAFPRPAPARWRGRCRRLRTTTRCLRAWARFGTRLRSPSPRRTSSSSSSWPGATPCSKSRVSTPCSPSSSCCSSPSHSSSSAPRSSRRGARPPRRPQKRPNRKTTTPTTTRSKRIDPRLP